MVITMVPVAGIVLYMAVGIDRRKQRIFNRKGALDNAVIDSFCREQLNDIADPDLDLNPIVVRNKEFITLMLNNNKSLLTMRNRVEILNNGDQTFPAMLEEMRRAEHFIHIESFIMEGGRVFDAFFEILADRVAHGVEVRVIYDSVGSRRFKDRDIARMRSAGVDIRSFMPVIFTRFTSKVNYRNHRKIIVIDGRVAFTGGINIADRYIDGVQNGIWRDTHMRITGESVRFLQAIFVTDWAFVTGGEELRDAKYFPASRVRNITPLQIASSGPDSDWASIMQAYFAAITRARHYIYVSTPYLLPNQAILTALRVASLSGVDVRLVIPLRGDNKIVSWASYSYVEGLLEAGVKVYLYQKGFNHSKFLVIDDAMCSIGSANLDIRSFEDDFEVQAIIYDPQVANRLKECFMADVADSMEATPEMWASRPEFDLVMESLSRLLSPLL